MIEDIKLCPVDYLLLRHCVCTPLSGLEQGLINICWLSDSEAGRGLLLNLPEMDTAKSSPFIFLEQKWDDSCRLLEKKHGVL